MDLHPYDIEHHDTTRHDMNHACRPIMGLPIMPLGFMYAFRVNVCS